MSALSASSAMPVRHSSMHMDLCLPAFMDSHKLGDYNSYPRRGAWADTARASPLMRYQQVLGRETQFAEIRAHTDDPASLQLFLADKLPQRYSAIVGAVFIADDMVKASGQTHEACFENMCDWYRELQLMLQSADAALTLSIAAEGLAWVTNRAAFLQHVKDDVHAYILQYHFDGPFATQANGLTDLGRDAVHILFERGKYVDLAHMGERARREVIALASHRGCMQQVIYSHGALGPHNLGERAITHGESEIVLSEGGIIALTPNKPFYSSLKHFAADVETLSPHRLNLGIGGDECGIPRSFYLHASTRGLQRAINSRAPDGYAPMMDVANRYNRNVLRPMGV